MVKNLETRDVLPSVGKAGLKVEKRGDGESTAVIVGRAAVYYRSDNPGTEFGLWGGEVRERVMPGAFSRSIDEGSDVMGLLNHEVHEILGRISAGTLRLSLDTRGLNYEIDVPDVSYARDALINIANGNFKGSSFGFVVRKERWVKEFDGDGNMTEVRELHDVDLYDVSPVVNPAYPATFTDVRSGDGFAVLRERRSRARGEDKDDRQLREDRDRLQAEVDRLAAENNRLILESLRTADRYGVLDA